jgi:hypothetical protein
MGSEYYIYWHYNFDTSNKLYMDRWTYILYYNGWRFFKWHCILWYVTDQLKEVQLVHIELFVFWNTGPESAAITDPYYWRFNIWNPGLSSTTTTTTTPPTTHTITTRTASISPVNTNVSDQESSHYKDMLYIYILLNFSKRQRALSSLQVLVHRL